MAADLPSSNSTPGAGDGGDVFDLSDERNIDVVCTANWTQSFRVDGFGVFEGASPLSSHFPLLLLQTIMVIAVSRALFLLLRPLRQPRIVCDILGGILVGNGGLGLIPVPYTEGPNPVPDSLKLDTVGKLVFNKPFDYNIFRTLATVGLMFYMFVIGVKMDPRMLVQSGRRAWAVGLSSLLVPFVVVGSICYAFKEDLRIRIAKGHFLIFAVAASSITALPVLAEILAEMHLLNSELGRLAMSAAMVHNIFVWFFAGLFTALNQTSHGMMTGIDSMLSLVACSALAAFGFRPWMQRIVRQTPRGSRVPESQVVAVLLVVAAAGFVSDAIGASFIDLPIILGLAVPEGPPLGAALVDKAELVATEVLLPLIFVAAGMEVDVVKALEQWKVWTVMTAVLALGCFAKLVGTVVPAMHYNFPLHNAFILGLIMNFRGLVELLTFLNFKNGELLGAEGYTVLLLSMLVVTAITVPVVSATYKPLVTSYYIGRRTIQHLKLHAELRILACVHNEEPVATMINLLEASCPTQHTPVCAYVLHLVELVGRAHSTLIAHKNKKGFINPSQMDPLHNIFIGYEQSKKGNVAVQPFTSVTPFRTMHQDICSLAAQKSVALILLPVPCKDSGTMVTPADLALRSNLPEILAQPPCSVGLLVPKSIIPPLLPVPGHFSYSICLLFWGGPDDREALAYASRMARHTGVSLTVTRFVLAADTSDAKQRQQDDDVVAAFKTDNANNEQVVVEDVGIKEVEQTIEAIRSVGEDYDLVIVGRRQGANALLGEGLEDWIENPELGVVGDMLASADYSCRGSILVIQQQP